MDIVKAQHLSLRQYQLLHGAFFLWRSSCLTIWSTERRGGAAVLVPYWLAGFSPLWFFMPKSTCDVD